MTNLPTMPMQALPGVAAPQRQWVHALPSKMTQSILCADLLCIAKQPGSTLSSCSDALQPIVAILQSLMESVAGCACKCRAALHCACFSALHMAWAQCLPNPWVCLWLARPVTVTAQRHGCAPIAGTLAALAARRIVLGMQELVRHVLYISLCQHPQEHASCNVPYSPRQPAASHVKLAPRLADACKAAARSGSAAGRLGTGYHVTWRLVR